MPIPGKPWFVVTASEDENRAAMAVWTVSQEPTREGWATSGGHPGFGLTLADAAFLAQRANEAHPGACRSGGTCPDTDMPPMVEYRNPIENTRVMLPQPNVWSEHARDQ